MSTQAPRVLFLATDVPRDGETGGQIASWRLLQAYATFAQVDVLALTPPGAIVPTELNELARNVATVPVAAFHYRQARLRLLATLAGSGWVDLPTGSPSSTGPRLGGSWPAGRPRRALTWSIASVWR